ncbi:MAG: cation transporter [Myxococcota bacterium]|nr:cation transporter [Myxococcota bacterium]
MKTVELEIQGMSCGHCVKAVEGALRSIEGVQRADVTIGHATIECDDQLSRDALATAIRDAGYEL